LPYALLPISFIVVDLTMSPPVSAPARIALMWRVNPSSGRRV
jgi:hypothetical protein